ncbi:MAG: SRPBCC domain-containing protein [Candidatus Lambdaproteobacteria bacterium]|nr:SRPBCC domain-containing protein [Candidatus Lambdaproteobacteria bacterium]
MSQTPNLSVTVTHRFAASAERVFDAWLDPALIGRWMFGPALRDEQIVRLRSDARVGGSFSFLVRRDGQELDHVGTYLVLQRPRRLEFTWGIGEESGERSQVRVEIAPLAGGCALTLTHELHPDWADFAERTRQGWSLMLGALGKTLDSDA